MMMDVQVLIFVFVVSFLSLLAQLLTDQSIISWTSNIKRSITCSTLARDIKLECCKSGYRGLTCTDVCELCLTRDVSGQKCIYYCRDGYYGIRCNETCPITCANGTRGSHICNEVEGRPACVTGCIPGLYGTGCDQNCTRNCLNNLCFQADGKCIKCKNTHYHGDHCNIPCSKGCTDELCNRDGTCKKSCEDGFYGKECGSQCGSKCVGGRCISDGYSTIYCTEGCEHGYTGTNCSQKYTGGTWGRNQQLCETGINMKALQSTTVNWVAICVPVALIIIIIIIIMLVCWKQRRKESFLCFNKGHIGDIEENHPLIDRQILPGHKSESHDQSYRYLGILNHVIEEKRGTFVMTTIYNTVETCLKKYGHVTISGVSGEGKTTLALMIGDQYRKKGYRLVFVDDPETFNINTITTEKTFYIFDDIFRSDRLTTHTSHLKKLFEHVLLRVKKCKKTPSRKIIAIHTDSRHNQKDEEPTFIVVFTTKSFNLKCALSNLTDHEIYLFSPQTVFDLTTTEENKYNNTEKKAIFNKHKEHHTVSDGFPVEQICERELTMLGFPMTCNLFFKVFDDKDAIRFFSKPLEYLEKELKCMLDEQNAKSAALLMMMLYEDGLNLKALDSKSDSMHFKKRTGEVKQLISHLHRADILMATKNLQGIFFTKGNISYFSHPAISDACASFIFDKHPNFLLKNCSLKFLHERIHSDFAPSSTRKIGESTIHISEAFGKIIARRLAEGIKQGQYSLTISHPILKNKEMVDQLFKELGLGVNNSDGEHITMVHLHSTDEHKCFLHWAAHANSLYLVDQILVIEPDFTKMEMEETVEACVTSGNIEVLELLLRTYSSLISMGVIQNAMTEAAWKGNYPLFQCLLVQKPAFTNQHTTGNTLLNIACSGGNVDIVKRILESEVDVNSTGRHRFTPIMNAVECGKNEVLELLLSSNADSTLADEDNDTVFHIACQVGNASIVKQLLPLSNINLGGESGKTPVMYASYSGKKDVFDLLVTKGADLTTTDDYGDTVLHHACQGGNTSIIEHLLPLFDINIRGCNGWTPVMKAAFIGNKEVFDLLVTKGADLKPTSNHHKTVLHLARQGGNTSIVEYLLPHGHG